MRPVIHKRIRLRTAIVGFVFSLLIVLIGAKAVYVQAMRGPWLSDKAISQYQKSLKTIGKRGTIFDSRERELAVDRKSVV